MVKQRRWAPVALVSLFILLAGGGLVHQLWRVGEVQADRQADHIAVEVRVTNENAGHHIPTDQPMRNMLLVISARDAQGREL